MREVWRFWVGAGLALTLGLFSLACQPPAEAPAVHWTSDPDRKATARATESSEPAAEAQPESGPRASAEPGVADPHESAAEHQAGRPVEAPAELGGGRAPWSGPPAPVAASADGWIEALSGRELTLATRSAVRRVELADTALMEAEGPGTQLDLQPGRLAAVVARPNGTATSIRLYPPGYALAAVRAPLVGARQGEILTTGQLTAAHPSAVVVSSLGQHFTFVLLPETLVLKPVPLAADALAPGQRLLVSGERGADGVLVATRAFLPGELPPLAE